MTSIINYLNNLQLSSIWEILLGAIFAFFLVYFVEFLRKPDVEIKKANGLILNDGRKILKVKVSILNKNLIKRIFPWKDTASFARLKIELLEEIQGKTVVVNQFTAKWDSAAEPWDYDKNQPRIDLLPASLTPENLLVGDVAEAAIAIKHPKEPHFYVFDPNYYLPWVRDKNIVDRKIVKARIVFRSSAVIERKEFLIINENISIDGFNLKELNEKGGE